MVVVGSKIALAFTAALMGSPAQPNNDFANIASNCGQSIALPEPRGPHQVGTSTFQFVDRSRPEGGTANPNDQRQVIFQLWYPAVKNRNSSPVAYAPELETMRAFFSADSRDVPQKIAQNLERYGCVLTHAFADAPSSSLARQYPVLVFSPGGNMSRHWHTAQAQEFASRGFIVVMLSHALSGLDVFPGLPVMAPDRWALAKDATAEQEAANDSSLSDELAMDARFALDRVADIASGKVRHPLNGRVDLARVAIAGHSRGGNTVGRACSTDPRFKACITYDNIGPDREQASGIKTPQLIIRTPWGAERKQSLRTYLAKNPTYAADVEIAGTTHFTFTDLQIVDPAHYEHKLDPVAGLSLANAITLSFIGDIFAGKSPALARFAKAGQVEVWSSPSSSK